MRKAIPADLRDDKQIRDQGASFNSNQSAATPRLDTSKLRCPKELTEGAKKEWRRVVNLYRECNINVLNDLDIEVLKSYCLAVDIRALLYKQLVDEGFNLLVDKKTEKESTKDGPEGITITKGSTFDKKTINPILRELDRYANTIRVLAEQLALTPVGRAAYAVRTVKANKSPAEEFMDD